MLGEAELEATLGEMLRRGDQGGDIFYDTISALHKSVRGSDPDATLYWLARMLDGGVDPRYVARRPPGMGRDGNGLARPRPAPLADAAAQMPTTIGSAAGELGRAAGARDQARAPRREAV